MERLLYKEKGKRVLSNRKDKGGRGGDNVSPSDPLDDPVASRTDGILMPMRKNSCADEKKFSWARERNGCKRENVC